MVANGNLATLTVEPCVQCIINVVVRASCLPEPGQMQKTFRIYNSCKLITPLKDTPSLAQLSLGSDSDTGPSDPAGDKETTAMQKTITDSYKHSKWQIHIL